MSLENLYARMVAGTAKYRPRKPLAAFNVDTIPTRWTPTWGIMALCERSNSRTLRLLHELSARGIVERRGHRGVGYEWRRIEKEKR